ncbi:MAG TPA: hypothetical protein P5081_12480 [Phycisphaerae bacterium]|nr:hypothetical protein [Phycisphaerae bacterium]HRW53693.1 hypothetical protein [Phycisphaerae bacterium]
MDPRKRIRHTRRAFTFVELLIAASITAMTLAAGATMISAVSNAAVETSDTRNAKKTGQMTADRLAGMIRQARAVGVVTSTTIILWNADLNDDEIVNLHETCLIEFDGLTNQLYLWQTQPTYDGDVGPALTEKQFSMEALWTAAAATYSVRQTIFAENILRFSMSGFPEYTETRIVNFKFAVETDSITLLFRESASPRASADYLFNDNTHDDGASADEPSQRVEYSRWTGWADVDGDTVKYPG